MTYAAFANFWNRFVLPALGCVAVATLFAFFDTNLVNKGIPFGVSLQVQFLDLALVVIAVLIWLVVFQRPKRSMPQSWPQWLRDTFVWLTSVFFLIAVIVIEHKIHSAVFSANAASDNKIIYVFASALAWPKWLALPHDRFPFKLTETADQNPANHKAAHGPGSAS